LYVTVADADADDPPFVLSTAVMTFFPGLRETLAENFPPETPACTPLTITLRAPEPAESVPVTVTGEDLTVDPLAGEEIATLVDEY
jgi:hypothetical protein